jgi:RNA polymerase sigma-32 factor
MVKPSDNRDNREDIPPAEASDIGKESGPAAEEKLANALVPTDTLQRYLSEIRRYPVLSREEEHKIALEYKEQGSVQAAYKLVTANLRLVVMIAREYQRAFRNLLDLIQEGNIGLMEAVKNFDPYRGVRFPSYAVWWIRAYIIRYLINDWRMVKIGTTQAQRKLFFNLQKEKEKLEAEGFTPGPKLLAERLNVKEGEVIEMEQRLANRDISTDVPMGEDGEATLLSFLPDNSANPEESVANAEYRQVMSEKIEQFASGLKDKDLVIFRERLLNEEPRTLREIGERYGISRERVRQIEERLKKRLKDYLSKEFKDVKDVVVDDPGT